MASEDVLEMLDSISRSLIFACDAALVQETARKAAAEVRERRRDKARLDFVLERCWIGSPFALEDLDEKPISDLSDRNEIDAAMAKAV